MGELPEISQIMDHAKKGDLEFFKEAPPGILLNARDSYDDTVLSIVVYNNHLDCCEVICKRCPSLLYHQNRWGGNTPLHNASNSGNLDILKLLITACDKADQEEDRAGKQKTLTLTTSYGSNAMHRAVYGHQPESIKLLIEADPINELLKACDRKKNTPLHLAIDKAEYEIARSLIKADPDFPYGTNSDRKTPLLIAIDKAELQNHREMLKLILELQPNQSMVSVNKNGWTALHYSVSGGFLVTIGCIIQSCPESSKVTDNEGRNFFHHAVKSGNVNMVKHILGMEEITSTVLNRPDNLGRTPWDVAAVSRNESMILCLHEDHRVNKKLTVTKNLQWIVEEHNFVMMNKFLKTNADLLMNIELEVIKNSVDKEGDTIFFKAAQENHLFLCQELYKRCPSLIYHQSKVKRTALHHAAWKGEPEMLNFLIEAGAKSYAEYADDNIKSGGGEKIPHKMLLTMLDEQGRNALHRGVLNHKLEAVKLLVEADPNKELLRAADRQNNTALHLAVRLKSDHDIARLLIEADPDFSCGANSDRKTPLLIGIDRAERHKDRELLKFILEVQPNQSMVTVNKNGWTALHYSVSGGFLATIGCIIQSFPESSKMADNEGQNFFHHAVKSGNVEMVKLILGMKEITSTVLNCPDNLGRTPLDVAAVSGNESMVLSLHEDPRVNKILTVTKNLNWVVEKHNFVMMNMCMESNVDFLMNIELEVIKNSVDENGDTILFKAAQENHLFLCKGLYKVCPSLLYHQSKDGHTALHHAAWRGESEMLKFLIEAGAKSYNENAEDDVESGGGEKNPQMMLLTMVDEKGQTALHKAVQNNKRDAVKLLLEADPNNELLRAGDDSDNTPLHFAVSLKSDHEIARFLIEADSDFPYGANSDGKIPLLIAIDKAELHNNRELLKLILEVQPTQSMVSVNENGWTALHYSVSGGLLATIGCIIQSFPESSKMADNEGQNFFHHAVKSGNVEMVKHILGMKEITSTVLNGPDNLGRTPLDVAAVSGNESIILCLHEDHRVNKILTVTKNLQWVVENHNFVMMNKFLKTNVDFLMNIELEVFLNSVDEEGDTILFKAVQENHLFLCKELYKRCPSLIYHQSKSKGGCTALHHAAWKGEPKMLKFLIAAGAKSYNENAEDDIESGGGEIIPQKMLLTMLDDQGDTALHRAVLNHKYEAVKLLVEADPDYEYGANTSGDTPIMISVREARPNENKFDSGKIRKLLFKMQPSQTMARRGENGWTLLHQATSEGDLSIIEDIMMFCTRYLDLEDNEGKNFLHIAAKLGKVEVVRQVLRAKDVPFNVLNNEDNDGNTPLHIAAMNGNDALTKCFLYDLRVIKTTENKAGQHVLKAINFTYDKRKAGVFGITVDESDLKDQREFDLVVGALIATVSFTAGITVPGGYISDGPNQGTAVLSKKVSFATFIISNTFALIFSLYAVFSHFCARRMSEEADFKFQLEVATFCTSAAIYCMMAAFIAGSFAVLANSNWLAIVVCIISSLFFIFACYPIWKIAKQRKSAASASQHKRST